MSDDLVKRLRDLASLEARAMPPAWQGQYELYTGSADLIEELEEKLAKAEWLLVDATVQLEEGKIKTRRNRAALIRQFLAELTGDKE